MLEEMLWNQCIGLGTKKYTYKASYSCIVFSKYIGIQINKVSVRSDTRMCQIQTNKSLDLYSRAMNTTEITKSVFTVSDKIRQRRNQESVSGTQALYLHHIKAKETWKVSSWHEFNWTMENYQARRAVEYTDRPCTVL